MSSMDYVYQVLSLHQHYRYIGVHQQGLLILNVTK
jgi:hypothetical protein